MTTAIKRRRGTTTEHSTFVGLEGELTIDVTKDTVVVHDGSTTGGFPLLREDLSNNANVLTTTNTKTLSNKTLDLASNTVTGTLDQFNAALSDSNFVDTTSTQTIGGVKTFSSNPVLSGGTANGVLYLNGSKVATSGTALTFDGNGQVISVNSSTNALRITQTGSGNALLVEDITNPDSTPFVIDASGNVITGTTASVAFNYASTPRFEVVGTSQSSSAIATASFNGTAGAATSVLLGRGRGTVASPTTVVSGDDIGLIQFEAHDGTALIPAASILAEVDGTPGTGDMPGRLVFSTTADGASATTERMRIDSSGNLGLGVTPSAWRSSTKAIDISTYGAISQNSGGGGGVALYGNSYEDGVDTYKYKNSYYATLYRTYAGQHQWFYAPSGTAGTAITFTQAMTLDASNSLLVGTTTAPTTGAFARSIVSFKQLNDSSFASGIQLEANGNTNLLGIGYNGDTFQIGSSYRSTGAYTGISFSTGGSERARIDTSGNLLVGTTSAIGSGTTFKSANGVSVYRNDSTAAYQGFSFYSDNGSTQATKAYFRNDGGLANYSANNVNLSDERLKKDIQLSGNYLAKICAIQVRNFRFKSQDESEDITLGVIAQEVEAVAPELVCNDGFGETPEDGVPLKSIYQTDLQYALMKCIQELKAENDNLKARLDAANL